MKSIITLPKPVIPVAKGRPIFLPLAISAFLLAQAPLHANDTDERIAAAARQSYVFKTFLSKDTIKTESKDGNVTLRGTVAEESHKLLAQHTVAGLPGVTSVDNQLEVKGAPEESSDTWLFLKIKSTLAFHHSVSAYDTKVDVKEGVVTLKGEATSAAQRDLTSEFVKDIEGVKEVRNEMTVPATEAKPERTLGDVIDDASITAQVRMALVMHRSTSAIRTGVTTAAGVVTVSGEAANTAEKDLVTKLVTDVNGVSKVINNMIVAAK